jgi:alpha-1,3-mannosyltransferase
MSTAQLLQFVSQKATWSMGILGIASNLVSSVTRSRPRSFATIAIFIFLCVVYWNPRIHHNLSPQDYLPILPQPASSPKLEGRFLDLERRLEEHFNEKNQPLPERVYPYHALTQAQQARYSILAQGDGVYMFTTITRQIQDQLPDLLAAIVVVVDTLGSTRVSFSFLEGPSSDLTPSVFRDVLQPFLVSLNIPTSRIKVVTDAPKIDFSAGNRIDILAQLRNEALEPLWNDTKKGGVGHNVRAVVSFNDVFLKAEHFLEVLYWHQINGAGMTTAWDWWKREPGYYYDIWVGRTVDSGDLFYSIDNPWWSPSTELFPNSPESAERFESLDPFPVFSSWNGLAVFDPKPVLHDGVRFRRSDHSKGECASSECMLLCSDFWKAGSGRIQVVPAVQVGRSNVVL